MVEPSRQPVAHQIAPTIAIPHTVLAVATAASRWLASDRPPGAWRAAESGATRAAVPTPRQRTAPARILATSASPPVVGGMGSGGEADVPALDARRSPLAGNPALHEEPQQGAERPAHRSAAPPRGEEARDGLVDPLAQPPNRGDQLSLPGHHRRGDRRGPDPMREGEDLVAEPPQRRVQVLRPLSRREQPGDRRGDQDADQRAEDAVAEEPLGRLAAGGGRQRQHDGGVAGQDDPVGPRRAHEGARAGAERGPGGEPADQRDRAVREEREEPEPHGGADQGAHHPEGALVEEEPAGRLGGQPDGHGGPVRVVEAERPGGEQRQLRRGGGAGGEGRGGPAGVEPPAAAQGGGGGSGAPTRRSGAARAAGERERPRPHDLAGQLIGTSTIVVSNRGAGAERRSAGRGQEDELVVMAIAERSVRYMGRDIAIERDASTSTVWAPARAAIWRSPSGGIAFRSSPRSPTRAVSSLRRPLPDRRRSPRTGAARRRAPRSDRRAGRPRRPTCTARVRASAPPPYRHRAPGMFLTRAIRARQPARHLRRRRPRR